MSKNKINHELENSKRRKQAELSAKRNEYLAVGAKIICAGIVQKQNQTWSIALNSNISNKDIIDLLSLNKND